MHHALCRLLAAVLVIVLLAALPAVAQNRPAPAPLFETAGLAVEALDAIAQRVGHTPEVALIDIRGSEMIVHVQGARPHHIDRWTWVRGRGFFGTTTRIRGPEVAQPLVPTLDPTTVFFPLDGLPLDDLPALIERITPHAMLEEPALPRSIRIERQLLLLGGTRAGELRIMVHWSTERESSYVYLNPDGSIRSADVSGTFRARGLDMARDDWHLPLAAADFAFLDGFPGIRRVEIDRRGIKITYDDPQNPGQTTGMGWSLNGLKVSAPLMAMLRDIRLAETEAAFNYSDIDFAVLPALKAEALARVNEPGVQVLKLVANRPITGTGAPQLAWTLTIGDPARQANLLAGTRGEAWQVVATPAGEILNVVLPPGRRPAVEWWTPANLRDVIDRLAAAFPPGHAFREILLNPLGGRTHAVDGSDPTLSRDFAITAHDITAHDITARGNPHQHAGIDAMWFTLEALDGYSAEVISNLVSRTFETVGLPEGHVSRLTFSRGNTWVRPPEGQVMLEIRVEHGMRGGRLTWLADGTELDRVLP
jgi:hypothetical protein